LTIGASLRVSSLDALCTRGSEYGLISGKISVKDGQQWNAQNSERGHMDKVIYFHLTLRPHLKHSGSIIDRRILFLAEVQVGAAREKTINPDDEDGLHQEALRLAEELLPIAMTGHHRREGEDVMQLTCHIVPKPPEDLLQHTPDADTGGVRLWLFGSNVE
jgi:hypothetical protein